MTRDVKKLSNKKQSETTNNERQANDKKPFNKKKYRLQKYSKDYKINQWEERRKKAILRDFYKDLNKDKHQNVKVLSPLKSKHQDGDTLKVSKQKSAIEKAKEEFLHKKEESKKQKEEALRIKAEREEALKKYKEKKVQAYKKLSKRTKKGQPVMKDRIEMLLEKIQQQVCN